MCTCALLMSVVDFALAPSEHMFETRALWTPVDTRDFIRMDGP